MNTATLRRVVGAVATVGVVSLALWAGVHTFGPSNAPQGSGPTAVSQPSAPTAQDASSGAHIQPASDASSESLQETDGTQSIPAEESAPQTSESQPGPEREPAVDPLGYIDPSLYAIFPAPVKDRQTWTLPTDPYFNQLHQDLADNTYRVLYAECLQDQGYDDVDWQFDPHGQGPVNQSNSGHLIFTPENAGEYGYRLAPDPRIQGDLGPHGDNQREPGPAAEKIFADESWCSHEAARQMDYYGLDMYVDSILLDVPPEAETQAIRDLESESMDTTGPEFAEVGARWRQCMAPVGYEGLADNPGAPKPNAIPYSSKVDEWNAYYRAEGKASPEEKAVAAHDARCRESSGWNDIFYTHDWDRRAAAVESNSGALEYLQGARNSDAHRYVTILIQKQAETLAGK